MLITSHLIGENKSFYRIFPVTIRNQGCYYCRVENQYGVVKSNTATVTIEILPTVRNDSKFTYLPSSEENYENLLPAMSQIQDTIPSAYLKS